MATTFRRWTIDAPLRLAGCGVDAERADRFAAMVGESGHPFPFVFSWREIAFARANKQPAACLAASFCCKEAVLKALGEPYDFTQCVFLASPAADYLHGAVIPVDGGWLAR